MSPDEIEKEPPVPQDENPGGEVFSQEDDPSSEQAKGRGNWPEELKDLQRRGHMSPEWHERGRNTLGEVTIEIDSPESSPRQNREAPKRLQPPHLFREVASRLGFTPSDNPPNPPRIELDDWVTPENRPPDFWDPDEEGGMFGESASSKGGTPEKLGEKPRVDEEADPPPRLEPGPAHGFTADAIAFYHPWHAGGDKYWGIYFREKNMNRYIERIERMFGWLNLRDVIIEQVLQHEMEHFEQEKAVFVLEDLLEEKDLRSRWVGKRRDIAVHLFDREKDRPVEVKMVQEALATAREIEWAKDQEKSGFCPPGYAAFLDWDSRSAPTGYRDFHLCVGQPQWREGLAAYLESVGSVAQPNPMARITGRAAKILFGKRTPTGSRVVPVYVIDN